MLQPQSPSDHGKQNNSYPILYQVPATCCSAFVTLTGFVLAAVLLLAGGTVLAHQRLRAATNNGKVKYIHVITTNSSCDGIEAGAAAQLNSNCNGSANIAVPAANAALLQHMLPLTNFSALRTGQILDSAAAVDVPVQQLQPLMQLHQHLWCR